MLNLLVFRPFALLKTFHSIPCLDVHVDAMDVAGENQMDIDHDMLKQRLGPDGVAMGEPFAEVVSIRIAGGKASHYWEQTVNSLPDK